MSEVNDPDGVTTRRERFDEGEDPEYGLCACKREWTEGSWLMIAWTRASGHFQDVLDYYFCPVCGDELEGGRNEANWGDGD